MNKITIVGRLTKDPTFTQTNSGIDLSRFTVASKSRNKNEDGTSKTTFFMCLAWRVIAENIMQYCKKGDLVSISGSIDDRWYEADGVRKQVWEVTVEDIEFLTTKEEREKSGNAAPSKGKQQNFEPIDDDNLPF